VGLGIGMDTVEKRKILHCLESKPGLPAHSHIDGFIPTPVVVTVITIKIIAFLLVVGRVAWYYHPPFYIYM
jgi:hypothetical protein